MGDKWTLLIIRDLVAGPRRFVELQRVLPGISTEQLRSRLNRMVADGLLTRQRYREVPPRVDYELTERARGLLPVIGALAAWGFEWAWGPPNDDEAIDIGAIFRSIPGLIRPAGETRGLVELVVMGTDGEPQHYAMRVSRGSISISERAGARGRRLGVRKPARLDRCTRSGSGRRGAACQRGPAAGPRGARRRHGLVVSRRPRCLRASRY